MAKPLKKLTRFVSNNRVYFIALGVALMVYLIWYYYQKSKNTTDTTGKTKQKYRIAGQRYFDPQKVYKMLMLTDVDSWETRCRAAKNEGMDTVQLVVPISETWNGVNNYDFSTYIEYANVAVTDFGLNVVLKPHCLIFGKILGSVFTQSDMMQSRSNERLVGQSYQLSFSSTKWNEVYNWYTAFEREFRPFHTAGFVPAVFPSCTVHQEWGYRFEFSGDFNPLETAKSGNLNSMGNIDYQRFQSAQLKEKFFAICTILSNWRVGFDAGSFYSNVHKFTGSYDYDTIASHSSVKFIKNNPAIFYSPEFNAALQYEWKVRRNAYYSTEWTNADGATAQILSERHRLSIAQGCNLLSFAFHAPDAYGGGASWETFKQTKKLLSDSGDWTKPVQTPSRTGSLSYSLADIFNAGGYEANLLGAFNTLRASNGGAIPNVRCTG